MEKTFLHAYRIIKTINFEMFFKQTVRECYLLFIYLFNFLNYKYEISRPLNNNLN